jgi:hypothetical protein
VLISFELLFCFGLDFSTRKYFGWNLECLPTIASCEREALCVGVGAGACRTSSGCEKLWTLTATFSVQSHSFSGTRPAPSFLCFSFASCDIGRMWCSGQRQVVSTILKSLSLSLSSGSWCHVDRPYRCPPCDRKWWVLRLSGRVPLGPNLSVSAVWRSTSSPDLLRLRPSRPPDQSSESRPPHHRGLWPSAPPCQLCLSSCKRSLLRPSWVRTVMSLSIWCVLYRDVRYWLFCRYPICDIVQL